MMSVGRHMHVVPGKFYLPSNRCSVDLYAATPSVKHPQGRGRGLLRFELFPSSPPPV